MKAFGKNYHKMNADDRRKFLDRLHAQEEFKKIKEKLNLHNDDDKKIGALKQEIKDLMMKDKHKQNTKSFSLINDLAKRELGK